MSDHVIHIQIQDYAFDHRYRWICSCGSLARVWQDLKMQALTAGSRHVARMTQGSLFPRLGRKASP